MDIALLLLSICVHSAVDVYDAKSIEEYFGFQATLET